MTGRELMDKFNALQLEFNALKERAEILEAKVEALETEKKSALYSIQPTQPDSMKPWDFQRFPEIGPT